MKKNLFFFSNLFIIWLLAHSLIIIFDGLTDDIQKADIAVVLGNKIEADGQVSPRLKIRLVRALELYQKKMVLKILVSGGIDPNGHNEAVIMKKYLVKNGVKPNDILLDEYGNNTYLTALHTKSLLVRHGFSSVIAISHYYHISRIKLAFKNFKIHRIYTAHANILLELTEPYSIFREFVAYYYYLIRCY